MIRSCAKYGFILAFAWLLMISPGCNSFSKNFIRLNVSRIGDAPKLQSLMPTEPVTIYVEGNAFTDQVIASPVKRGVRPTSIRLLADIKMEWHWKDGGYDNYLDPEFLHPAVVEEARRIARHLGCNALVIDRSPMTKTEIPGSGKSVEVAFLAGTTP